MKRKEAVFAAAQDNWEQKTTVYGKELAELRPQVNGKSTNLFKNRGAQF